MIIPTEFGEIPYYVSRFFSLVQMEKLEAESANFTNSYFTRRATGYPDQE
jgi:hypothetical protein